MSNFCRNDKVKVNGGGQYEGETGRLTGYVKEVAGSRYYQIVPEKSFILNQSKDMASPATFWVKESRLEEIEK